MRITSEESIKAYGVDPLYAAKPGFGKTPQATTNTASPASPAAQVEVSDSAQALAASHTATIKAKTAPFLAAVQAAPDTRDALVSRLKAQVESGTYKVSASDIAEQAIRRAKADNIQE